MQLEKRDLDLKFCVTMIAKILFPRAHPHPQSDINTTEH